MEFLIGEPFWQMFLIKSMGVLSVTPPTKHTIFTFDIY